MEQMEKYYRVYAQFKKSLEGIDSHRYMTAAQTLADDGEDSHIGKVYYRVVDLDWVEAIESTLVYIDKAIREQRRFIEVTEEVVPIEKARGITTESVRHLAQHTNLIARVEGTDVTPERILNIQREESFAIYENRFLYTLLQKLAYFVGLRYKALSDAPNDSFSKVKLHRDFQVFDEKIEYDLSFSIESHTNTKVDLNADVSTLSGYERVLRIRTVLGDFLSTPLMRELTGCEPVRPPILHTNLMTKNPNFKKSLDLWNYIETYTKPGYQAAGNEFDGMLGDKYKQALYDTVVLQQFAIELCSNPDLEEQLQEDYEAQLYAEEMARKTAEEEKFKLYEMKAEQAVLEERNALRQQIDELNKTIASHKKEIADLTVDNENKERKIQRLSSEVKHLEKELSDKETRILNMQLELDRKTSELEAAKNEAEKYKQKLEESEARVAELEEKLPALEAKITALEAELAAATASIAALSADVAAKQAEIEAKAAEIAALNESVASLQADISAKAAEIIALQDSVSTLKARVASLEGEVAEQAEQITRKDAELAEQAQTIGTLQIDISEKASQITALDTALSEKQQIIAAHEATIVQKDTALSERAATIAGLEADAVDKENTITALQADLAGKAAQIQNNNATIQANEAELAARAEQIGALQADIQARQADIAARDTTIGEKERLVAARESDIDSLKSSIEKNAALHKAELDKQKIEAQKELDAAVKAARKEELAAYKRKLADIHSSAKNTIAAATLAAQTTAKAKAASAKVLKEFENGLTAEEFRALIRRSCAIQKGAPSGNATVITDDYGADTRALAQKYGIAVLPLIAQGGKLEKTATPLQALELLAQPLEQGDDIYFFASSEKKTGVLASMALAAREAEVELEATDTEALTGSTIAAALGIKKLYESGETKQTVAAKRLNAITYADGNCLGMLVKGKLKKISKTDAVNLPLALDYIFSDCDKRFAFVLYNGMSEEEISEICTILQTELSFKEVIAEPTADSQIKAAAAKSATIYYYL